MPGETSVNKDFLKDIFTEQKKLLKKKEVDYIAVPQWDELGVMKLWHDLKDDAAFNVYFQDTYTDQKAPNREYFFNILNTIYPDYLKSIVDHAREQRFTLAAEDAKPHAIHATDEWLEALNKLPYKSCKFLSLLSLT